MVTPNAERGPLEVVVVYAFDSSTTTPAYTKVDKVYWLVQDKIGCFASSSRLSYIYFMSSGNSCTTHKRFARSGDAILSKSRRCCTANMASGLGEAHRLISQCENPNGIILLLSDGLVDNNKGDFFNGTDDFVSTWPVHTFTVGENAYNQNLQAIAAKSPGGTFNPIQVPDEPTKSVLMWQHLDDILGCMKDDEKPPTLDGSNSRVGLVTMKKPRYSRNDVALTADSLTVGVELNAPPAGKGREGLDLVVVLDIQGSWEGGDVKLAKIKRSMELVIKKLTPMDRLSIVSSKGDHVNGLRQCPLRCMTPAGKAELKALVGGLRGRGINLQEGLMEALGVIRGRVHTQGRTANIFFITDDREYVGDALSVDPGNVAVHTFGFGNKAGHELLKNIAKKSAGGTYSFVPDDSDLCAPMSQMLGGLLTIAAQDLQLTLTSKANDVETMAVAPGVDYKQTTNVNSRGEKEITISFGTIFCGESRKVSVNFTLKPSKNTNKFDATIAEAQHSYNAQQGLAKQPPRDILIRRTGKPTAAPSVDAAELHAEEVRHQHAVTIGAATDTADAGNLEEARYKLQDGLNAVEDIMLDDGDKMVGILRAELLQLIKFMASKELYQELGRPYALATVSSHGRQRTAAKGDAGEPVCLYVTPRMITHLQQAKQFQEDPNTPLPSADEDLQQEIAANPLASVAGPLAFYLENAIQALQAIQKIIVPTI